MKPYLADVDVTLYHSDALACLRELPDESVHCIATSPPFYALRSYLPDDHPDKPKEHGLENTPEEWAARLVEVFREARRVLRRDGSMFMECGDSYASTAPGTVVDPEAMTGKHVHSGAYRRPRLTGALKPKDLLGQPFLLAFALRADGWYWRGCYPWHKPNAMPESAKDRCTTSHSYVLHFARSSRYFFDADAISEPAAWERWGDQTVPKHEGTETAAGWIKPKTKAELVHVASNGHRDFHERWGDGRAVTSRHPRSVWTIPTQGFSGRELFGGDGRIPSPDCPVHGDRSVQVPRARRDEHGDAPLPRTPRSDARPVQEQLDALAPTDLLPAQATEPGSSDLPDPSRAGAATPHSIGIRKTDHAPATTEPCTPFAQSSDRTGDTSASPESSASGDHIPESNTEADSASEPPGGGPSAQTISRSADTRKACTCKYIDHFATWPEALARRIILAGCPEGGTVLDPFGGSGTTALVARKLGRKAVLIELNPDYCEMASRRLAQQSLLAEACAP